MVSVLSSSQLQSEPITVMYVALMSSVGDACALYLNRSSCGVVYDNNQWAGCLEFIDGWTADMTTCMFPPGTNNNPVSILRDAKGTHYNTAAPPA